MDFVYRKTVGRQFLETRVISIAYEDILTEGGTLSLRYSSRHFYGRKHVEAQILIGCRYQIAISTSVFVWLGLRLEGRAKLPYLEYVVRGVDEPERGCAVLYPGS